MKKLLLTVFLISNIISSQEIINDTLQTTRQDLDEVIVKGIRAKFSSPISFTNVDKQDLKSKNLGQDLPILLNFLPSVVTTSDAGAGIGYTGIRIRGVSPQSTNITINGIPFNDPESMGTFWVNLPDFSSSIESMQVQRGVGTSTNGSGAFGASINILTDIVSDEPFAELSSSFGSYNTLKNTIKFSTGKINDHFELSGRLSKIDSDGYVDRAYSDLKSYFIQGAYTNGSTLIKAISFGGHEKTYQAWDGLSMDQVLENRRQNPLTYENEIDNYKQDHFQLHWNEKINNYWSFNLGLNYTDGRGYFEQYKEDDDINTYGGIVKSDIDSNGNETGTTDLIRRRWFDNDFYGILYSLNKKTEDFNVNIGGSINKYNGLHYGEYLWYDQINSPVNQYDFKEKFYDDFGDKGEFNIYAKIDYYITDKLTLYGDLQFRNIKYEAGISANSTLTGYIEDGFENLDKSFNFFNPKFGLFYNLNDNNNLFFSFARAHREPTRTDYANGNPNEEKLDDFELGWKLNSNNLALSLNAFYMIYEDQLVLTGQRDINGYEIRRNIGESYRVGIEFDSSINLKNFGNTDLAYSPNLIVNNILNFNPNKKVLISLRSKYVGEQFFAQTNSPISKLESFFINDINFVHDIDLPNISDDIKFKVLVNNLFDYKYSAYGGYYSYDIQEDDQIKTYEGTYYYPQSGINILVGLDVKF